MSKIGGKVIEIEGVLLREKFRINPSEKVITKLFALRQKYKDENNNFMQLLLKLIMNALYREIVYGNYIGKMKNDEGFQDEVKKVNTLPLQLAVFILSNSKRIMNFFIHAFGGFYTNDVY